MTWQRVWMSFSIKFQFLNEKKLTSHEIICMCVCVHYAEDVPRGVNKMNKNFNKFKLSELEWMREESGCEIMKPHNCACK